MALVTKTALFGVDDCKIFEITKDDATGFTCGTGIDVPGIRQASITFEIDEKELMGDEKTLAVSSKIKSITFNAEYAQLSLDVLALLSGGTVTATGTTKQTFSLGSNGASSQKYFQFQAQIKGVDFGGDVQICIYKAKATAIPINGTQGDYATYTFDGKGVFTEYVFTTENKLVDIDFNKPAGTLAAKVSA